jgi:hypothetical protein
MIIYNCQNKIGLVSALSMHFGVYDVNCAYEWFEVVLRELWSIVYIIVRFSVELFLFLSFASKLNESCN